MNLIKTTASKVWGMISVMALSGAMITLTGCNDFLDQEVLGNNTDENFYDTKSLVSTKKA